MYRCDAASNVNPRNRFDKLWQFLRDQNTVLVQLEQLQIKRRPTSARACELNPRERPKERLGDRKPRGVHLTRPQRVRRGKNHCWILAVCVAKRGMLEGYTTVRHLRKLTQQSGGLR